MDQNQKEVNTNPPIINDIMSKSTIERKHQLPNNNLNEFYIKVYTQRNDSGKFDCLLFDRKISIGYTLLVKVDDVQFLKDKENKMLETGSKFSTKDLINFSDNLDEFTVHAESDNGPNGPFRK